jgi:uncharacterized ferredoxin-like protein
MILNPESEALETLAKSILLATRTAPKAREVDDIVTALVEKKDIEILASAMERLADEKNAGFISPSKEMLQISGKPGLLSL